MAELFSLHLLHDVLDGFCEQWEAQRLARKYGSYGRAWRAGYLTALVDGTAHAEPDAFRRQMLVHRALGTRGRAYDELSSVEQGKVAQEHVYKLRTLAYRTLFLRTMYEDGLDGARRPQIVVRGGLPEKMTHERCAQCVFH